ncbi:MAG: IS110 family transposase [Ilumatobacteraceae bacterium]
MTTMGIDLAVRAAHVATLTDDQGRVVWTRRRFHNLHDELVAVSDAAGPPEELTVVMEPTRNAWVIVAAHFRAIGAKVVLVAPEQSSDLRRYFTKHTKNDRLDSLMLARMPLLHPEGLSPVSDLGPADALKRAVRRRVKLVESHLACRQRLDAMLDLLGPRYAEVLGVRATKTALHVLEHYGNPYSIRRLGLRRLTDVVKRTSGGHWNEGHAERLLAAAHEAITLWAGGGIDFDELAWDLASEVRVLRQLDDEIARLDTRITGLYDRADPKGIIRSAPGIGDVLAGGILGRLGDANRFANLAAIRSFSGMVPGVNQSGFSETSPSITKQGDPGLRRDLWFAADLARHQDPQLAAKYHRLVVERRLHHFSAVCHIATTLLTRIGACWRNDQLYIVRDIDGQPVDREQAKAIIAERYSIPTEVRRRKPAAMSEPTKQESTNRSALARSTPTIRA